MAGAGHNVLAADRLLSVIERVEHLEEEKATLAKDISEVYSEAKGDGYCTKTIRKIVALRKLDPATRAEAQAMFDLYANAVGLDLV
jgi:uncharacterized protein (UPF0335 family)